MPSWSAFGSDWPPTRCLVLSHPSNPHTASLLICTKLVKYSIQNLLSSLQAPCAPWATHHLVVLLFPTSFPGSALKHHTYSWLLTASPCILCPVFSTINISFTISYPYGSVLCHPSLCKQYHMSIFTKGFLQDSSSVLGSLPAVFQLIRSLCRILSLPGKEWIWNQNFKWFE